MLQDSIYVAVPSVAAFRAGCIDNNFIIPGPLKITRELRQLLMTIINRNDDSSYTLLKTSQVNLNMIKYGDRQLPELLN